MSIDTAAGAATRFCQLADDYQRASELSDEAGSVRLNVLDELAAKAVKALDDAGLWPWEIDWPEVPPMGDAAKAFYWRSQWTAIVLLLSHEVPELPNNPLAARERSRDAGVIVSTGGAWRNRAFNSSLFCRWLAEQFNNQDATSVPALEQLSIEQEQERKRHLVPRSTPAVTAHEIYAARDAALAAVSPIDNGFLPFCQDIVSATSWRLSLARFWLAPDEAVDHDLMTDVLKCADLRINGDDEHAGAVLDEDMVAAGLEMARAETQINTDDPIVIRFVARAFLFVSRVNELNSKLSPEVRQLLLERNVAHHDRWAQRESWMTGHELVWKLSNGVAAMLAQLIGVLEFATNEWESEDGTPPPFSEGPSDKILAHVLPHAQALLDQRGDSSTAELQERIEQETARAIAGVTEAREIQGRETAGDRGETHEPLSSNTVAGTKTESNDERTEAPIADDLRPLPGPELNGSFFPVSVLSQYVPNPQRRAFEKAARELPRSPAAQGKDWRPVNDGKVKVHLRLGYVRELMELHRQKAAK